MACQCGYYHNGHSRLLRDAFGWDRGHPIGRHSPCTVDPTPNVRYWPLWTRGAGAEGPSPATDQGGGRRGPGTARAAAEASLLIALYSVRSERAFCEELAYNLPFRWFLDMGQSERGFDAFTKNW